MRGIMDVRPVVLEGRYVVLEPLAREHHAELCEVGIDAGLWQWTISAVHSPDAMQAYIDDALRVRDAGYALPFVIRERASGRIVGSTRYGNIDRINRRVEFGWTWIARPPSASLRTWKARSWKRSPKSDPGQGVKGCSRGAQGVPLDLLTGG